MINTFEVHGDGKTAYERITRHRCNHKVTGFVESFLWQIVPDKNARDKLNGDFRDGTFLGIIWMTMEYLIGTAEGVLRFNTLKPRVAESAYDQDCIDYINGNL